MIHFARETLTDELLDELLPLLEQHWVEVGHYKDIPLDVNREVYLGRSEHIRFFTARSASGAFAGYEADRLLGYCLFFVAPNPHYQTSVYAVEDVIFLDPSVRGTTGYRFIAWCDDQLREEGVQVSVHHSKAAHDFGRTLEHQGYELVDHLYAKRLDRVDSTRETKQADVPLSTHIKEFRRQMEVERREFSPL